MKVLFVSNYPSPYRVDFFNLLGQYCELVVCFLSTPEEQRHRSSKWFNNDYSGFNAVFLYDKSNLFKIKTDIKNTIKQPFDIIVFGGYSSPTQMYALEFLRRHKIPYYLEADGGMIKKDNPLKKALKTHYISGAAGCFSSGSITTDYFAYYGANKSDIYEYLFTSQKEADIVDALKISHADKKLLKQHLSITEEFSIVTAISPENTIDSSIIRTIQNISEQVGSCVGIDIICDDGVINIEKEFEGLANIHVHRPDSEFAFAKQLAASDLYLGFTESAVRQAKCFGLPVVQVESDRDKDDSADQVVRKIFEIMNDSNLKSALENESVNELIHIIRAENNSDYEVKCVEMLRTIIRWVAQQSLGMKSDRVVISVGQFIHRKGFDILLNAAPAIDADVYIIGGKPEADYTELASSNVHFIDFMTKDELKAYYRAATVYAMPTREDIWGLVVNEALSYGLPVVSSDKCVAGLELIKPSSNGYIVPVEDSKALAEAINAAMDLYALPSYKSINNYTLENMSNRHIEIFEYLQRNRIEK